MSELLLCHMRGVIATFWVRPSNHVFANSKRSPQIMTFTLFESSKQKLGNPMVVPQGHSMRRMALYSYLRVPFPGLHGGLLRQTEGSDVLLCLHVKLRRRQCTHGRGNDVRCIMRVVCSCIKHILLHRWNESRLLQITLSLLIIARLDVVQKL